MTTEKSQPPPPIPSVQECDDLPPRRRPDLPHDLSPEQRREIAMDIIDDIARGGFLINITQSSGMPHPNTFRNWLKRDPDLAEAYAWATEDRAEFYTSYALLLAAQPTPSYEDAKGRYRRDPAAVAQQRLHIKACHYAANMTAAKQQARNEQAAAVAAAAKAAGTHRTPEEQAEFDREMEELRYKIRKSDLLLWFGMQQERKERTGELLPYEYFLDLHYNNLPEQQPQKPQ